MSKTQKYPWSIRNYGEQSIIDELVLRMLNNNEEAWIDFDGEVEIQLSMNGVPIDFKDFVDSYKAIIDSINSEIDMYIAKEAEDLLRERLSEQQEILEEAHQKMINLLAKTN